MKLTITIEETQHGDVECELRVDGFREASNLEAAYARHIVELLKTEMPKINKALGGLGTMFQPAKPENS